MAQPNQIPASPESEEAVLGSLILDPDAYLEVVGILKPENFWVERNSLLYKTILKMNENRQPVDFVTLCDELERDGKLYAVGGAAYLSNLVANVPTAAYAMHYAEKVLDYSLRRDMILKGQELAMAAWDFTKSPRESISEHISGMTGFSFNERSEPTEVRDSIGPLLDMVQNGGIPSVTTGYRELDRILRGGFKPVSSRSSRLVPASARPPRCSIPCGAAVGTPTHPRPSSAWKCPSWN